MSFTNYLEKQTYKPRTILNHINILKGFKQWLKQQKLNEIEIKPFHILSFIDFCRTKGNTNASVQIKLRTLSIYFNYLTQLNRIEINPCTHIKLKNVPTYFLKDLLNETELNEIFQTYKGSLRNKTILSLMIYQALSVRDFDVLETTHIDLTNAKVTLQGHSRANARTLDLKAFQIILIHTYLTNERPHLNPKSTNKLILSKRKGNRFKDISDHFILDLKTQCPKFKTFAQLRKSRICNWLNHYNLREVQVMAGHKNVSSTEKFKVSQIDDLSERVDQFHPLNETDLPNIF